MADARPDQLASEHSGRPRDRDGLAQLRGCFLGGAVGDALGAPVEFMDWHAIQGAFGPEGIRDAARAHGRVGAITDDTQMLLFTAEGLLRAHHHRIAGGPSPVEAVVHGAYSRWLRTQGERPPKLPGDDGWLFRVRDLHARRAPGNTCLTALRSGLLGTVREPLNDSKGCGGVMRIAPAGLAGGDPFQLGCELAALTHGHPTGYVAAGFFAQLVHELARGLGLRHAVVVALEVAKDAHGSAETVAAVGKALDLAARPGGTPSDVERLGGGWTADEAVAISVYCALQAKDFAHGVRMAVNHSGDSDSTGSMTGNLLGLVHGEEAIPRSWLEALELRDVIGELAEDFWWHFRATPRAPCGSGGGCGQGKKYPSQ